MDIKAAVQPLLDNPHAQALIAQVTTEESKQTIIAELYDMLPRPVRWVLKQEAFDGYMRQHVFRETQKASDQSGPKTAGQFPSHIAAYRQEVEQEIAKAKESLEPLVKGVMHIGSRSAGSEGWKDMTPFWIDRTRETIAVYEKILAAIDSGKLGSL